MRKDVLLKVAAHIARRLVVAEDDLVHVCPFFIVGTAAAKLRGALPDQRRKVTPLADLAHVRLRPVAVVVGHLGVPAVHGGIQGAALLRPQILAVLGVVRVVVTPIRRLLLRPGLRHGGDGRVEGGEGRGAVLGAVGVVLRQ